MPADVTATDSSIAPWDVVVVGAGAAGLVAAERAASRGLRTLLLEKNRLPGVKILMSGGTRCNLTHDTDARGIVAAYGPPGRFLHSALAALGPTELVALVEDEGVPTKIEETGKVFPVSNKAADVLDAFVQRLRRSGASLSLGEPLAGIERPAAAAAGFRLTTPARSFLTASVILTCGGQSYPGSGTTGDGYAWARQLGHNIVPPRPALTPVTTAAAWVRELSGVTVPDVALRLIEPAADGGSTAGVLDRRRGSFLFTHFGLSGPAPLDISRCVTGHPRPNTLRLECDFLPTVGEAELEARLQAAAASAGKRQLLGILPEVLPRRLLEALLRKQAVPPETRAAELSRQLRQLLVRAIKRCEIPVAGARGFGKAEVTAGGVPLDEVDSRDMQSKRVPGLYFAGEILDLDGPIGGYNFQAAFSTGWLAGSKVRGYADC
jgi:predicted Rossmann fold flavoprotein